MSKFQVDLIWNYASLAALAVSGIAINVLIGHHYGPATLGSFNQVLATFIVFSMVASGGLGYSVLRATAEHSADEAELRVVVVGAILPALGLSAIVSLAFFALADPLSALLESPAAAPGIRAATGGLFCFAMNKVLLSTVNGMGRMRAYSVFQTLRSSLLLAGLLLAVALDVPGERLPGIFTLAESILALALFFEISRTIPWWRARGIGPWARDHLRFGLKGGTSGVLVELNARVDVLMIGYFLSDSHVGVYSFAAFFAEGFFQILVVLQNLYHPILAKHLASRELGELERIIRRAKARTYAGIVPLALLATLVFPVFVWIAGRPDLEDSQIVFAILVSGTAVAAGYLPFQNTLAMANLPGWQTLFMLLLVSFNVIGNAISIPIFGIEGAAMATALSVILSVPVLLVMVRRLVGLRI